MPATLEDIVCGFGSFDGWLRGGGVVERGAAFCLCTCFVFFEARDGVGEFAGVEEGAEDESGFIGGTLADFGFFGVCDG